MLRFFQLVLIGCLLSASGCAATAEFLLDTVVDSALGSDDADDLPKPLTDRMSKSDARRANWENANANRAASY